MNVSYVSGKEGAKGAKVTPHPLLHLHHLRDTKNRTLKEEPTMSGKAWLEALEGTLKENTSDTDVPRKKFWKSYPRKGAKGAKASLDTLLHLSHPRHCKDSEKSQCREGVRYEQ